MYESEITHFLQQLKAEKPDLEERQRQARARWWDKTPVAINEAECRQQASVAQPPYVYYQNF
jgi:hypothetical protein